MNTSWGKINPEKVKRYLFISLHLFIYLFFISYSSPLDLFSSPLHLLSCYLSLLHLYHYLYLFKIYFKLFYPFFSMGLVLFTSPQKMSSPNVLTHGGKLPGTSLSSLSLPCFISCSLDCCQRLKKRDFQLLLKLIYDRFL